jgi:hypothetical protein
MTLANCPDLSLPGCRRWGQRQCFAGLPAVPLLVLRQLSELVSTPTCHRLLCSGSTIKIQSLSGSRIRLHDGSSSRNLFQAALTFWSSQESAYGPLEGTFGGEIIISRSTVPVSTPPPKLDCVVYRNFKPDSSRLSTKLV